MGRHPFRDAARCAHCDWPPSVAKTCRATRARSRLETLRARLGLLLRLARLSRIDSSGKLLAGGIALGPRRFQFHIGIDPQRKALFLARKAILPAPPLATSGANLQIEAATIEHLDGLCLRLCRTNRSVCQRHVGATPFPGLAVAPRVAPNLGAALAGRHRTTPDTIPEKTV